MRIMSNRIAFEQVWPTVAIGYNEVNNTANAALFFAWAYGTVQPPFNVVTEEPGGAGCDNFLTGAGGILQAVWAGWGGVRLRDNRLDFMFPSPPPGTTSLRLAKLSYMGVLLQIDISSSATVLSIREENQSLNVRAAVKLDVSCNEQQRRPLNPGSSVSCLVPRLVTVTKRT